MPLPDELHPVLHAVEVVAGAIREALGEEVDAYPGARSPEQAEPMNRAFRSVAVALLLDLAPGVGDAAALVPAVLREAAGRRLGAEGWTPAEVRFLTGLEPVDRFDWHIFLLLSSRPQIEPLFTERGRDGE